MRYEHSNQTAWTAFNNLPLVPPTPRRWGRRPTTANTPDHDFDRAGDGFVLLYTTHSDYESIQIHLFDDACMI